MGRRTVTGTSERPGQARFNTLVLLDEWALPDPVFPSVAHPRSRVRSGSHRAGVPG